MSRCFEPAWFDDLRRLGAASGGRTRGAPGPGEGSAGSGGQLARDNAGRDQAADAKRRPAEALGGRLEGADAPEYLEVAGGGDRYIAVVVTEVTEAPGGAVHGYVAVRGHELVDAGCGPAPRPAAVTVSCAQEVARVIVAGEVPPSVAYMQGTVRMTGATGRVLDLLACTATPRFAQLLRSLEEVTDW